MASRPPDPSEILTVSALNQQVRANLEATFPYVWVSGEISRISRPSSGHLYFALKDDRAVVNSVIYRGVAFRLRFELKEKLQVLARGRVSMYEPRGECQLNIEEIVPKGIGPLELALQQLKEKLAAKGYFDARRKKPMPRYPRSIALVTSPSGAAIRDMLEILSRRWPIAATIVVPVRVQGDGSANEIAAAIRLLNQLHDTKQIQIEAMIIGRGGGSLEDLWAFNEEPVADAIFASRIPIISAVGHEIDVTISDFVADHRALTPSHAITDLTPDCEELLADLREREYRLRERMARRIELARQRVDAFEARRSFRAPLERIRDLDRRLDDLDGRLRRAIRVPLDKVNSKLAAAAARLETLSPLNVLSRGYSLTRTDDGSVIRDVADLEPGQRITTRVNRGAIVSRIEKVQPPSEEFS